MANVRNADLIRLALTRAVGAAPLCEITLEDSPGNYDPMLQSNWLPRETPVQVDLGWAGSLGTSFTGAVEGITERWNPGSASATARVHAYSIFRRLLNKPCNTEEWDGQRGNVIMNSLAQDYGGVPAAWCNIVADNNTTIDSVILHEKSVLDALKKVAQACRVEIYVGADGKLTTSAYHDEDDTPTLTIAKSDLRGGEPVSPESSNANSVSRVRVRGRWQSAWDDGQVVIGQKSYHYNADAVKTRWEIYLYCDKPIFGTPTVEFAWVTDPAPYDVTMTVQQVGGDWILVVLKRDDGVLATASFTLTVRGRVTPHREVTALAPELQSSFKTAQEQDPLRLESAATDDDQFAALGLVETVVDNDAIPDSTAAQAVADYVLNLSKWGRDVFALPIVYTASLELNQVVKFPYRGHWFHGLVRRIVTRYQAGGPDTPPTLFQIVTLYKLKSASSEG